VLQDENQLEKKIEWPARSNHLLADPQRVTPARQRDSPVMPAPLRGACLRAKLTVVRLGHGNAGAGLLPAVAPSGTLHVHEGLIQRSWCLPGRSWR